MKIIIKINVLAVLVFALNFSSFADIKVRQRVSMSGQTFETTKMIKGARERTEQKSDAKGGAAVKQSRIAQKFDGAATEAVHAAIDEALDKIWSEF